jgi:hypothetical protein
VLLTQTRLNKHPLAGFESKQKKAGFFYRCGVAWGKEKGQPIRLPFFLMFYVAAEAATHKACSLCALTIDTMRQNPSK